MFWCVGIGELRALSKRENKGSLKEIFTRNFIIIATINFAMFFSFQMTTIGMPVYVSSLGATAQVVGLVTTLLTISATIVRVFAGALLDRFGRKGTLIAGTAIIVFTVVSYAIFPIVGVILLLRLIQGVGWGLGTTASSTIAADIIPQRHFAEGMGYFAMTMALSGALAPAVALELAGNAGSFVMIMVAAAMAALAFVLSLFQSGGATAADLAAASAAAPSHEGESASDAAVAKGEAPAPRSKIDTVFERGAIVPGILIFLVNFGFGAVTTFVAIHASIQGIANPSIYFIVYAICSIVTRPLIGKLIDRIGFRLPAIISTIGSAITLVLIGISSNELMLAIAGIFAGLGVGTATSVFQAMAVASVPHERHGVAMSTFLVFFDLGIAVGALLAGAIADVFGFALMFVIIAVTPLIACVISLLAIKSGQADYAK